jgi:diketogulonate reductase-like aldo/keto reductase
MQTIDAHGARIPVVGFGTWTLRGRDCANLVKAAIEAGYRHIDTAQMYDNERAVGEGVRAAGTRDVFVTTKIQPENLKPRDVERSARESLAALKRDVIDLLLIHWPNPAVPLADTLGAMARLKQAGLTRHIGVSNFTVSLIEQAVTVSPEPLVCNQIECHPFLDQSRVIAACRRHGLAVVAYSPIARGSADGNAVLTRIGKAHGKSAAQVSLRWLVQQGIVVIPRTSKPARLRENIDLFDFELSPTEMSEVAALSGHNRRIVDWSWSPQWD